MRACDGQARAKRRTSHQLCLRESLGGWRCGVRTGEPRGEEPRSTRMSMRMIFAPRTWHSIMCSNGAGTG